MGRQAFDPCCAAARSHRNAPDERVFTGGGRDTVVSLEARTASTCAPLKQGMAMGYDAV